MQTDSKPALRKEQSMPSEFNQPEYEADKRRWERANKLLDTLGTWLVIGNIGGLGFLYNALLSGHVANTHTAKIVGAIFACGAILGFLHVFLTVAALQHNRSHNKVWMPFTASAIALIVGLTSPLVIDFAKPSPTVAKPAVAPPPPSVGPPAPVQKAEP